MRFRADWVLPIADDPIPGGCVTVADGRIVGVGAEAGVEAIDLGRVAVLPALVNAHTHFELSYLRNRIPPADRFLDWIRLLMATRREYADPSDPAIVAAARQAIADARASGTGLAGDVSNTLVDVPLLGEGGMAAHVFYELLGFNEPDPAGRVASARASIDRLAAAGTPHDIRLSLAPHAPYSVSPALMMAIRADLDTQSQPLSSVHVSESAEEVEFVRTGAGAWRTLLESLGVWSDDWQAPGSSPAAYLIDLGFLDRSVLAVHGVQFDGEDLTRLAALGVTVVSCPRSNQYVGVGAPPIEAFYAMDVDVAFGTDSLASVADLNLFAEIAEARRLAPRVPAARLLESATLTGARALGFERDFGSIESGKRAALIAVRLPANLTDVEEYLVSGIEPEAVTWVDDRR